MTIRLFMIFSIYSPQVDFQEIISKQGSTDKAESYVNLRA